MSRNFFRAGAAAGVLSLTALGAIVAVPASGGAESAQPPQQTLDLADRLSDAFQYVAETIQPSVVSIKSVNRITRDELGQMHQPFQGQNPFEGTPFGDLFGDRMPFNLPRDFGDGRDFFQEGQGSGFVISEDGYIVTNNHVIENADQVEVLFSDDRSYTAEVVGTDPKTDVAVLKVDASGLTPVKLGDSDDLNVGQWVVAAGNPFGLSSTITTGIVSATGRSRVGIADYEDFIQTDAAINPGNSGGPLVNLRGEVVGMNTAIFSRSGGNMGIGFAIPINMVKHIQQDLMDDGQVQRGWLGVYIDNLTSEGLAESFGYSSTDGVLVTDVTPGSPAERAGFQQGDVIVRFDGARVTNMSELRLRVAETAPGERVEIEIVRNGDEKSLTVEIGEMPSDIATPKVEQRIEPELGAELETLTPRLAEQLGVDDTMHGVVVTQVEPYSPAARAGLRRGDIILQVADEAVEDVGAFREALNEHDLNEGVRLTLHRAGVTRFVFLQTRE